LNDFTQKLEEQEELLRDAIEKIENNEDDADVLVGLNDQMGKIVELEIQKQMCMKRIEDKIKKFSFFMEMANKLESGSELKSSDMDEDLINDFERIFGTEVSKGSSETEQINKTIFLKFAECLALMDKSSKSENLLAFETFQAMGEANEFKSHQTLQMNLEEVKDDIRQLEMENTIVDKKKQGVIREIEKLKKEKIALLESGNSQSEKQAHKTQILNRLSALREKNRLLKAEPQ
jgi:hypothetical protein